MQKPRTAIGGIYHFIKALVFLLTVVIQSVTIVMLLTAIKNDSGYLWANIALVCVTAIYLVVFVISAFTGGRRAKRAKKNASRLKKIVKLFLKIATLQHCNIATFTCHTQKTGDKCRPFLR